MVWISSSDNVRLKTAEEVAFEAAEKRAETGNAQARHNLGFYYLYGEGVDKNLNKALENFAIAAKAGLSASIYSMGWMYVNGHGMEQKKPEEALKYFEEAAAKKYSHAYVYLAYMHYKGIGTDNNPDEAAKYCQSAVDMGDQDGKILMSFFYDQGVGVNRDTEKVDEMRSGISSDAMKQFEEEFGKL